MAAVDPYAPCPCGSGQKFKWCCHKVESFADKAQRLYEGGQTELAIATLNEGLVKEPGNPWLLTRKALYQIGNEQADAAKASVRQALQKHPKHATSLILMTRLVLETEGPSAGAAQFQQTLGAFPPEGRATLASLARVVATFLAEQGEPFAALAHAWLALSMHGTDDPAFTSVIRSIERDPSVSPWLKNPYSLAAAPEGLPGPAAARFTEALEWAEQGQWASAASAFELLSADLGPGSAADYNLGLCRLQMADDAAAIAPLRRYIARLGETTEAVDVEGLCQLTFPPDDDVPIDIVRLSWPLRDREALLKTLRDDPHVFESGRGPADEDDPNSPEVDHFGLLDRPAIKEPRTGLRVEEIPKFVAYVQVGQDTAALETYDDGRLDALSERFTSLARPAIAPAHPRTKELGKVGRTALGLMVDWQLPEGLAPEEARRLNREQAAWTLRNAWPRTPMPYLGGRTPLEAGKAGNAVVSLRAAMLQLEQHRDGRGLVDFDAMRAELGIAPEPVPDPATVDIEKLHLGRLALIPIEQLNDERLVALYRRARRYMLLETLERAATVLVSRPGVWEPAGIPAITLYSDLATAAATRAEPAEGYDWIRRGRQAESPALRAQNAVVWDLLEIRLKSQFERPEVWVPDLAVILERHGEDQQANQAVMMTLIEMGLVQLQPHPDSPEQMIVDSRRLQMLMAKYGPRVTTASGQLGVAASKPEIWTPGAQTGGGGLWTPGAGAAAPPPGDKPKLIIPGR